MANGVSQSYAPSGVVEVIVGGTIDVSGPLVGRSIIDGLRKKFSPSGQVQEGDDLMDRSRDLLRRHLQLMEVNDQDAIRKKIDDIRDIKNGLENFSGSGFQRLREARRYRRQATETYQIVKRASERGIDDRFMDQIAEAIQQRGGGSGSGPGTSSVASTLRNPFTDSHAVSTLTDITVNDLDRVDMSTYQAGDTNEAAVVLDLVAKDKSVQHIVATFPTEVFSGIRTDKGAPEAPTALSLHREDGTMPRFVAASPPDASQDQRANDGETRSLNSISSTELFGTSERSCFYPEPRP